MIKIIDNALPVSVFEELQSTVVGNPNFLFGVSGTAYAKDNYKSFAAHIEDYWQKKYFICLLKIMAENANIKFNEVFRVRLGLITRDIEQVTNGAHVDQYYKHKAALLYLNESDGQTVFYKNRYDFNLKEPEENSNYIPESITEKMIVDQRIDPKPNRVVFFDGDIYHSSTTPKTTQLRYAINYNFI